MEAPHVSKYISGLFPNWKTRKGLATFGHAFKIQPKKSSPKERKNSPKWAVAVASSMGIMLDHVLKGAPSIKGWQPWTSRSRESRAGRVSICASHEMGIDLADTPICRVTNLSYSGDRSGVRKKYEQSGLH